MKTLREGQGLLARRYVECAAFVLLWMALGFYLRLGPIAYQLMGLALIAGFQLVVARRPQAQLWAFDADRFRIDGRTLALAGGLFAACAAALWLTPVGRVATGLEMRGKLAWLIAAAALPAAFALRQQRAADLWRGGGAMVAAVGVQAVAIVWHMPHWLVAAERLPGVAVNFGCEFVALFLVDEVAFRGAVDPHLNRAGAGRLHAWSSAVFGSILWSLWHLPANYPKAPTFFGLFADIGPFRLMTVALGVALVFAARRSRTLVPTAAIHALANAWVLELMR